ncbi:MAG: multiheme c-type cytochrome [Candidatus Methanoperedens sp.]|nr:multiheme c-type cytochrome [Candidatus Methanoperedens sp.]
MQVKFISAITKITLFCIFIVMFGYDAIAIQPSDFTQPEVCGGCHTEIYAQWNGSMHSNSHKDPVYEKLFIMVSKEMNRTFDPFCSKCHVPIDFLSGNIPSADNYKVSEISEKGISCDFCHTVNASSGIGNGAFISSPGKIKRGPFDDSDYSTFHQIEYSQLHTRSEFCGMCHDVYHPFNGLVLENTYSEWKEGPYNETTVCQDCHMTPGVTMFKANKGRAAAGAPMREHIYTHYIVGGNAMLPELLGSPEHERLAKERLRSAAKIEIIKFKKKEDNKSMDLIVKVTNIGAGHKLPTGLTEARQIWLEIEAKDVSGKTIFESGKIDADGYIDHDAIKYHTVFGDAQGKPTEKVWLAEKILLDNRIPPKGYSEENFSFALPQDARYPLSVDVRLNYVSASQELSDLLFGKGKVKPPVIEMASVKGTIDGIQYTPGKNIPGFSSFFLLMVIFIFSLIKRMKTGVGIVGKEMFEKI